MQLIDVSGRKVRARHSALCSRAGRGHSTGGEFWAALARTYPHHFHESEDLGQTLMIGKNVCGVVFARHLEEEELLSFDALLQPKVGGREVTHPA